MRRVLFVCVLVVAACRGDTSRDVQPGAGETTPGFVDVGFAELHALFLHHKVAKGPKAALWSARYRRRWVRWTGKIRSFTLNGMTVKELPVTTTFDVSLWINNDERAALRARYKVGDIVTYVGRLDSYDDIWRTIYLVNGSVLGFASPPDGGL